MPYRYYSHGVASALMQFPITPGLRTACHQCGTDTIHAVRVYKA